MMPRYDAWHHQWLGQSHYRVYQTSNYISLTEAMRQHWLQGRCPWRLQRPMTITQLNAMPIVDTAEPLPDRPGPRCANLCKCGFTASELCDCGPMADYGSHHWIMSTSTAQWWSDDTPWGWWWRSQLAENHGGTSTRQMKPDVTILH